MCSKRLYSREDLPLSGGVRASCSSLEEGRFESSFREGVRLLDRVSGGSSSALASCWIRSAYELGYMSPADRSTGRTSKAMLGSLYPSLEAYGPGLEMI